MLTLSSAEASFAFGRVGSLEAGERVKESARGTLGKREERPPRLFVRVVLIPSADSATFPPVGYKRVL